LAETPMSLPFTAGLSSSPGAACHEQQQLSESLAAVHDKSMRMENWEE
jgi:hypothetical protein